MKEYMLIFSLGPVQSFIAQARKTRDLWLGSFLLSTLMEAGMKGTDKAAFVFPSKQTIDGRIPDLPNKFIATFNTDIEAKDCVKRTEKQIKDAWRSMCEDVWTKVIQPYSGHNETTRAIWASQINPDTLFEIYWAIVKKDGTSYKVWLERTQAALDARKRLRDFKPQPEEQGEKSTISGERAALRGKGDSREEVRAFWKGIASFREVSVYDLNKDGEERLDAIDTVKRFAYSSQRLEGIGGSFPSTSSIATATFVEKLLGSDTESAVLKDWIDATKRLDTMSPDTIPYLEAKSRPHQRSILNRDGDCYFSETFTPYRLKEDYHRTNDAEAIAREGQKALRGLYQSVDSRPTPYYALIQMDGDKMGTLLSGVEDDKEHTAISAALSDFSRKVVPHLVQERFPGRLIYAGGDDVLALAPLARDKKREQPDDVITVLDLVNQLQQGYRNTVKPVVHQGERQLKVTASTGIAIAHHYTSLSYVRRMSKAAEDLAKKHYGRNALVVTVLRRSGEQTRVGCHWDYPELDEDGQSPIKLFTRFYELFKQDALSPKCVYTLLEEAPALVALGQDAQASEIKRVLLRQRSEANKGELPDNEAKKLAEWISLLAEAMDNDYKRSKPQEEKSMSTELHSEGRRYGLVEVLGWLLVMVFLARKEQD